MSMHVTLSRATSEDGAPVNRQDAIVAAVQQLQKLQAADPTITGGTLIFGDEAIILSVAYLPMKCGRP